MFKRLTALAVLLTASLVAVVSPLPSSPTPVAEAGSTSAFVRYWAFCGVKFDWGTTPGYQDPYAFQKARAMATSGIEASHGPCLTPPPFGSPSPPNYSPAFPGARYASRAQQVGALWQHAQHCVTSDGTPTGTPLTNRPAQPWEACFRMKTIIYEPDLWSTNAAVRDAAVAYWAPHKNYIEAFDMGDEFDCRDAGQWNLYKTRMATVWNNITANAASPLYKIPGYSTHLPVNGANGGTSPYNCAEDARWNASGAWYNIGYDNYDVTASVDWAWWYNNYLGSTPRNLVCAVSVQQAGGFNWNPSTITTTSIVNAVGNHRQQGCDTILFFNPGNSVAPAPFSGYKSLSDATAPFARSDWGAAAMLAKNWCPGTCPPLTHVQPGTSFGGSPPPAYGF